MLSKQRCNQVSSWDITKLKGPAKWSCFHLYVILDIFSHYVVVRGGLADRTARVFRACCAVDQGHRRAPKHCAGRAQSARRPGRQHALQTGGQSIGRFGHHQEP